MFKNLSLSFLFALLFFSFLYVLFGIYLEDNNNIVAHIVYGELGPVGSDMYINDYHFLQMPFFYWVSQLFPNLPFYGAWYFLHGVLALAGIIYSLKIFIAHDKKNYQEISLFILLFFAWFTYDYVFFHNIKISLFLGLSGILLSETGIINNEKRAYWWGLFIFTLGLIIRMHSPVLILFLFMTIKIITQREILIIVKQYAFHLILSFVLLATYQIYGLLDTSTGKYFEANYEYAVLEKESLLRENLFENQKDSIKYEGIKNFFLSDADEFTIEYLQKTLYVTPNINETLSLANINFSFQEMNEKFRANWLIIVTTIVLIFIFILNQSKKRKIFYKLSIITIIAYAVPFALLIFLVDEMKMRFISPYLVIWSILCIREVWDFKVLSKWQIISLFILLTSAVSYEFYRTNIASVEEKKLNKERLASAKALYEYSKKYPLISFVNSDMPLVSAFFHRHPTIYFQNIAYFDAGYLTYFSYVHDQFYNLFGVSPLNYPKVITLLKTNKDLRLYATAERLSLIKEYFRIVYGYEFKYKLDENQPNLNLNGKIFKVY